jgi:hypothetical protein
MPIASLYAWNPHLDPRKPDHKAIELLLTPFAGTEDIAPERALAEEILACLHLVRHPVAWHVQPIRTSYFSSRDATGSERWCLGWSMTIELDHGIEKVPTMLNLNNQFIQLQIDLGTDPPRGFATAMDWAVAAEQFCRDHGGIPNNDEREDEWDVVFNEDGIACGDAAEE